MNLLFRFNFKELDSFRKFHIKVQRSRALIYTLGVSLAILAKVLNILEIPWVIIVLLFLITYGSSIFFAYLYYIGKRPKTVPLQAYWMGLDIFLFGVVIFFSGGSNSIAFPWAIANVAASAYVAGRSSIISVMIGNLIVCIAAVIAREGVIYHNLLTVIVKMLILYGASFFAIVGIPKLREQRLLIAQLKEYETNRANELAKLAKALEEKTKELNILNEQLREAALIDPLTGLYNRRYLEHRIEEDVAEIQRRYYNKEFNGSALEDGNLIGFIMIDIDDFKLINDTYGHDSGDLVLTQFAQILLKGVRRMDSVVRWGGEEFLIVIRRVNFKILEWVVERIIKMVKLKEFSIGGDKKLQLTCSAGFCCYPFYNLNYFSWFDIVNIADSALLLAKREGKRMAVGVKEGEREIKNEDLERIKETLLDAEKEGLANLVFKK